MLWIIRGLPGSGKSTKAKEIVADHPKAVFHYEADMYFTTPAGEYIYDPTLAGEAHSWCRFAVTAALEDGFDVIVSNTFVRRKDMDYYRETASKLGHSHKTIVCRGEWPNIHNVPTEVIERMKAAWEEE